MANNIIIIIMQWIASLSLSYRLKAPIIIICFASTILSKRVKITLFDFCIKSPKLNRSSSQKIAYKAVVIEVGLQFVMFAI